MKNNIIKRISILGLCTALISGNVLPVLANSTADVYATQGTSFSVNIPKTLVLDGTNGTGAYTVSVKGNIGGTDVINVVPDSTFNMTQAGKNDIATAIEQDKTAFNYADGMTATNEIKGLGNLTMDSISAGKWSGVFNFNIESTVDTTLKDSIGSVAEDITNSVTIGQDISQNKHTIYEEAKKSGLSLNTNNVIIGTKDTYQLEVYSNENNVTNVLDWSSSNNNIDVKNGLISTKASAKVGDEAIITATLKDDVQLSAVVNTLNKIGLVETFYAEDGISVSATVKIVDITYKDDSDVDIDSISIIPGDSKKVKAIILPDETGIVNWTSNAFAGINLVKNGNICTINVADDMPINSYYLMASYGSYSKLLTINIVNSYCTHNYNEVITKEPTCLEKGIKTYTCLNCNDSYEEIINSLGHDYNTEFTIDTAATCITEGSKSKHCNRCSSKSEVTVIPITSHTEGEWIITKQPTSTEKGSKDLHCSVCDAIIKTETIDLELESGLYNKEGVMTASWDELVNDGYLTVTDGVLTSLASDIDGNTDLTNKMVGTLKLDNSVTSIDNYVFCKCTKLKSVTMPNSVISIGDSAFCKCTRLTSLTIGNSVTSIGPKAFFGCTGFKSVTIGNSVKSIGDSAFYACSGLTSVTIENSVKSIGENAFFGCNLLTSVTIGNSVTSIENRAFGWCLNLTRINIPDSVTSIGKDAFEDVKHIEYHGTATGSPWGALSIN